jgi:hypothetical protein
MSGSHRTIRDPTVNQVIRDRIMGNGELTVEDQELRIDGWKKILT